MNTCHSAAAFFEVIGNRESVWCAAKAHQTNTESPEEVEELIAKTEAYAEKWAPVAEEIWNEKEHSQPSYENYTKEKREHPELAGFDHPDGTHSIDLN